MRENLPKIIATLLTATISNACKETIGRKIQEIAPLCASVKADWSPGVIPCKIVLHLFLGLVWDEHHISIDNYVNAKGSIPKRYMKIFNGIRHEGEVGVLRAINVF